LRDLGGVPRMNADRASFPFHWLVPIITDQQIEALPRTKVRVEFQVSYIDPFGAPQSFREIHSGTFGRIDRMQHVGDQTYPRCDAVMIRTNVVKT
jgi:hypothetical protein